jgi:chorismate synthase
VPRPGHADLVGALTYDLSDLRDVIERASARETAARVACGAVAKALLATIGSGVASHVVEIAGVRASSEVIADATADALREADSDPVRCLDAGASEQMRQAIADAGQAGDTVGGVFEVVAFGFPPGVGTYAQPDRRLGARLACALMSIPAIKGVEVGLGFKAARLAGSEVHDAIVADDDLGYGRLGNHAGGIEGGISTGLPIVLRAAMKPIATLMSPLASVELGTRRPVEAHVERSDVCAVPAAAIVGEAVVALALADAALERFGGQSVTQFSASVDAFRQRVRER